MVTVNIKHVINDQHITLSIDPVPDHLVVDNEVTIVTVTDNDDNCTTVASTQHSKVIQSSNDFTLIPSYKEGILLLYICIQ